MHCSDLNEKANWVIWALSYSHSDWVITTQKSLKWMCMCQMISAITVHVSLLSSECIKGTREWVNSLLLHVDGVWSRNQRLLKVTVPRRFNPSRSLSGRTLEHSRLCSHKLVMLNAGWVNSWGWVCVICVSACFFDRCMMWFMARLTTHY